MIKSKIICFAEKWPPVEIIIIMLLLIIYIYICYNVIIK